MAIKAISEIRRNEMIEAFSHVVAEKGFAKATIREVAKHAGCSYGVLNYHFANKEELILSFLDYVVTTYTAGLRKGVSRCSTATESLEFIFSYFHNQNQFTLEFGRVWIECLALANSNPEISEKLNACYDDLKEMTEQIIAQGISAGEFRDVDPTITSNLIWAALEGLTVLWVVNTRSTPVEALIEHRPDFFMSYLRKGQSKRR